MANVLVTGSSSGLGLAIADLFHQRGHKVVLNSRNIDALRLAAKSRDITHYIKADVVNKDECRSLLGDMRSSLGSVDSIICNVGSGRSVPQGYEKPSEWNRMLELNLFSVTNIVECLLEEQWMEEVKSIVCITSICGTASIRNAPICYSVAKAALNAYIRASCHHLARYGTRINGVAAGNIFTEGGPWIERMKAMRVETQEYLNSNVAQGRIAEPEEVARVVYFLSSKEASFTTGSIWTCDGGQTCI